MNNLIINTSMIEGVKVRWTMNSVGTIHISAASIKRIVRCWGVDANTYHTVMESVLYFTERYDVDGEAFYPSYILKMITDILNNNVFVDSVGEELSYTVDKGQLSPFITFINRIKDTYEQEQKRCYDGFIKTYPFRRMEL